MTALQGTGRVAMGLHAASGYLELSGAMFGEVKPSAPAARSILALPANTAGAFEVSDPGGLEARGWSSLPPALQADMNRAAEPFGLRLPQDFSTLFGSDLTVSAGPVSGAVTQPLAVQVVTGTGARAVSFLRRLLNGMNDYPGQAGGAPLPVTIQLTSKGYLVANDPGYAKSLHTPSGATLGSTPLYKAAVPHAAGAQTIGFLNVGSLLNSPSATDQDRRTLSHLGAVGLSLTQKGGVGSFNLRVTVK